MDGDKEHLTLEHETELCSDSLGWVGWKIHCHIYSSADKADGTEEEEATRTSAALLPLEFKKKMELHP